MCLQANHLHQPHCPTYAVTTAVAAAVDTGAVTGLVAVTNAAADAFIDASLVYQWKRATIQRNQAAIPALDQLLETHQTSPDIDCYSSNLG